MRIIGGRDYYDGAAMWGVDRSILFHRHHKPDAEAFDFDLPPVQSWKLQRLGRECRRFEMSFRIFLVGGEAIPAGLLDQVIEDFRVPAFASSRVTRKMEIFGSFEEVWEVLGPVADVADSYFDPGGKKLRAQIQDFFKLSPTYFLERCIDERIITGLIRPRGFSDVSNTTTVIEKNTDQLGTSLLMKLMDPTEAHMRIAAFVGGVLPQARDILEISDAAKIIKAGFDERSFRDWKGKKKPRGQRR